MSPIRTTSFKTTATSNKVFYNISCATCLFCFFPLLPGISPLKGANLIIDTLKFIRLACRIFNIFSEKWKKKKTHENFGKFHFMCCYFRGEYLLYLLFPFEWLLQILLVKQWGNTIEERERESEGNKSMRSLAFLKVLPKLKTRKVEHSSAG